MKPCVTVRFVVVLLAAVANAIGAAPTAPEVVRDGAMEKRPLFTPAALRAWGPEESTVAVSTERTRQAAASLHWHITVDYSTGEAKYPIGWPRVGRSFPVGPERDWSGWDFLHAWIYVATNREKLPSIPAGLGLHVPDRTSAYQRTLSELKAGEWVEVKIPLTQIPRHHDVRNIQVHIAESNYRDGDQLDFYLSDLALLRYAAPTLLEVAPESAVVFADAARLPLRLHLAGIPDGGEVEAVCELVRAGQVAVRSLVRVKRGVQTIPIEFGSKRLAPGDYEVRAHLAGQTQLKVVSVRFVESPWK